MAGRIPRLSTTFRRTLTAIGVPPKSALSRAVFATIGALGDAALLPGPADFETRFAPGGPTYVESQGTTSGSSIGSTRITSS